MKSKYKGTESLQPARLDISVARFVHNNPIRAWIDRLKNL